MGRRAALVLAAAIGSLVAGEELEQLAALAAEDECASGGSEDGARCALNALQHRSAKAVVNETSETAGTILSLYHWSPHWQCFLESDKCKNAAEGALNYDLRRYKVDFANVIELMDDNYRPPSGYRATLSTCNDKERATLFYNTARWKPGFARPGCMRHKDRAFVVQVFTSTSPNSALDRVVVVGAHYPHSSHVPALKQAIWAAIGATGEHRIIFMGDTNQEVESGEIAGAIAIPSSQYAMSSPKFITCCHAIHKGFVFPYDRIIANFGESLGAHMVMDPPPSWAGVSMHKGLHATIRVSSVGAAAIRTQSYEVPVVEPAADQKSQEAQPEDSD